MMRLYVKNMEPIAISRKQLHWGHFSKFIKIHCLINKKKSDARKYIFTFIKYTNMGLNKVSNELFSLDCRIRGEKMMLFKRCKVFEIIFFSF